MKLTTGATCCLATQIRLVNLYIENMFHLNRVPYNQAHDVYCNLLLWSLKCVTNLMLHKTCHTKRVFGSIFGAVHLKRTFKVIDSVLSLHRGMYILCFFFLGQGGMHVNGAPPLMQASMQGGVPAPGQIPTAVTGPGPGSLAPGGKFHLVFAISVLAKVLS